MGVRVLESQKDFEMVLKEAGCKLVVIDFSATWCGPCQTIKPRFHDLAEQCQISCMPTFHFYKDGERVFDFAGANRTTLEDKIRELQ
ncbi:thioredoxin-like isoform X2 [Cetorhinus maximus]